MPALLYSEITSLALSRIKANVPVDPPFTAAQILEHANKAYEDVYEASGAAFVVVAGSVLWTGGGVASTGTSFTLPGSSGTEEVSRILNLWASTAVGSVGDGATDVPLDPVDYSQIIALRASSGLGTYATPKVYSVIRRSQSLDTDGSRYDLFWWPSVAGFYFPASYLRQFDPFDGGASDKPDVNDIQSRDIAMRLASIMAPLIGRAELVPSIMGDISEGTREGLERKLAAQISGDQDR